MTAGARDTLITLQSATATRDEYNEEVATWADLGTEWAAVNYGRGDERREAAMEQGAVAATFNVLDNAMTRAVALKDRLIADGGTWDITSNVPGKRRGERDITAIKAA